MDLQLIIGVVDQDLRSSGTADRAEHEKVYLKSDLEHFGVSVPIVRAVAKGIAADYSAMSRDQLIELVDALWSVPVHERRMLVVELLGLYGDRLEVSDAEGIERLLRDSHTWALVDPLAASVMGRLVERHDELGAVLDRWATDDDFWIRRSALLALLVPLRQGCGDFERFSRYADAMLDEQEFFIRKAIGWVLRDTGKKRPDLVYEWVLPRAPRASGVTIREAVKPMSPEQRASVLAAR